MRKREIHPGDAAAAVPEWVVYPGDVWRTASPQEAGFDADEWNQWFSRQMPRGASVAGERHPGEEWGAVLVRGGYIVETWGDPNYRYNSASVGKCFTRLCLQVAIDKGLVADADDLVQEYWVGEDQLNHPDKYLDRGYHASLTFRHLLTMTGGFPVSNGFEWRNGGHPGWANPHGGDPDRANYAQREPGAGSHYSSGGFWRCAQALTGILGRELKGVLDEALFSRMGIAADRWDWLTGRYVRETTDFYPDWPGYGGFVDPPYEIGSNRVQGGGGWVTMCATDLARVGLLLATGGIWKDERLIGASEFVNKGQGGRVRGWGGGNSSTLSAWPDDEMLVVAAVTTQGLDWRNPPGLAGRPVGRS